MGCHRSGTNLLYDMLMSAGEFAQYADNLYVYQTLIPRFGDFSSRSNRQALMEVWLRSKSFRRSGLDAEEIKRKILEECNSGGDFYRIVMGEIVRKQNAARWAAYGPDNVFYMPDIHRDVPEALFVHIIRDGRDVAFGLSKKEWIPSLPWDRRRRFLVMGAFWKWTVTKAQQNGRKVASNYTEVHFEDLILHPRETLARLGTFLGQELDYDRIRQRAVGTVAQPNSSHQQESPANGFSPASRWKQQVNPEDVSSFEALYGDLLEELGYETASNGTRRSPPLSGRLIRAFYPFFFESKLQLKNQTLLGRFSSLFPLQLQ
ncbi:MAG TPA: sulfotransferase [Candidatus Acidoferrales bacterium]|nr:sulfotransferase [Candidatus Acidoferrales bacterium]